MKIAFVTAIIALLSVFFGNEVSGKDVPIAIATSIDLSDFDAVLTLRLYYKAALKNNGDLLYIMNYPAYYGAARRRIENVNEDGLGYEYGYETFIKENESKYRNDEGKLEMGLESLRQHFINHLDKYIDVDDSIQIVGTETVVWEDNRIVDKMILTFIAWYIAKKVWDWCAIEYGVTADQAPKLVGSIGGTNSFNPFNANKIKNEIATYATLVMEDFSKLQDHDAVALIHTFAESLNKPADVMRIYRERDIFVDMNGSMAWYTSGLFKNSNLVSAFIMGGVLSYTQVNTMSKTGFVNRFSYATMNQLYHPEKTKQFLDETEAPIFVITNNEINASFSFIQGERVTYSRKAKPTFESYQAIIQQLGLIPKLESESNHGAEFLNDCFSAYYKSRPADRKPFDVITALALAEYVSLYKADECAKAYKPNDSLLFNKKDGLTIVSKYQTKVEILQDYLHCGYFGKPSSMFSKEIETLKGYIEEDCFDPKYWVLKPVVALFAHSEGHENAGSYMNDIPEYISKGKDWDNRWSFNSDSLAACKLIQEL